MRFILLAAALALAAPAAPADAPALLDHALTAYAAHDFPRARRGFRALADEGSAVGETMLGLMHARAQGGRRDPAAAAACFYRAAQRGYAPAQLAFAQALARGDGIGRDARAALVWARLAAARGDARVAAAAAAEIAALAAYGTRATPDTENQVAGWRAWPSARD